MSKQSFLSRWSQRKRDAEQAKRRNRSEPASPVKESSASVPGTASQHAGQDGEARPEMSVEEITRLPPLEDLTAASDLTQFLREGVPQALRNAALRRAWRLDPAIRDYVGEARDYAYDWNTPGGVPGAGPLLASDDVKAMVRRIVGDRKVQPSPEAKDVAKTTSEARSTEGQATPDIAPEGASTAAANNRE
jgi:hypothetical protein